MKASVYIATSLDGFIARENGELDWLPGSDGPMKWSFRLGGGLMAASPSSF
jgi:dihydrofolate reductase